MTDDTELPEEIKVLVENARDRAYLEGVRDGRRFMLGQVKRSLEQLHP